MVQIFLLSGLLTLCHCAVLPPERLRASLWIIISLSWNGMLFQARFILIRSLDETEASFLDKDQLGSRKFLPLHTLLPFFPSIICILFSFSSQGWLRAAFSLQYFPLISRHFGKKLSYFFAIKDCHAALVSYSPQVRSLITHLFVHFLLSNIV